MNLVSAFRVEIALVLLAVVTLLLGVLRNVSARAVGNALALCLLGLFGYLVVAPVPQPEAGSSIYRIDELSLVFKQLCLLATAGVLVLAAESGERFGKSTTEHYVLMLLATTGMLVASTARDFVLLFVALELLTTASYVLVGFLRRDSAALEASVKYLAVGALSTAFLAYGISYIFGTAGTTSYDGVREALTAFQGAPSTIASLGITFVIVGVAFKIAVFPGHMWTADVYQGTPLPVTAFLAVASKTTGFAVLLRLLFDAFLPLHAAWAPVVLVIAGITIVWGNLGALRQRELKRLLGYSSMTHSGYLLFGTVAVSALGAEAMIFYLVQYLFTSLACFFVLGALARNGHGSTLDELAGLSKRAPFLSWALLASLLSMAGIPPLSGFLAKFLVFSAVPDYSGYEALYFTVLSLALVGVVVSAVYYLGVARVLWADGPREAPVQPTSSALWLGLAACVAVILVLGIYQDPVLRAAERASASLGLQ